MSVRHHMAHTIEQGLGDGYSASSICVRSHLPLYALFGKAGQRRDPRNPHQFLAISQNAPAFHKAIHITAAVSRVGKYSQNIFRVLII